MGILGKKLRNSRILEQFEHLPDILATFHGTNVHKTRLLLSTEHNKIRGFSSESSTLRIHYNLSSVIQQKGLTLSKIAEIFENFWEF